jgi:hypothetical protein
MVYEVRGISSKWFSDDTPVNFTLASAAIGSGENGTLTVKYNLGITCATTIAVVVATGANKAMAAALAEGKITITLGTGADSLVATAKNTVKLIATEISKIEGFTGSYSGTGADSLSAATEEDVAFTDGHNGTPCLASNVILQGTDYWYISTKADNTIYNDGWRRFTLASY